MRFDIEFHTPFRVASGLAGNGADSTVDRTMLLPASSLKGLMRWSASHVLKLEQSWVDRVYGKARRPSPWGWSDATITAGPPDPVRPRARVQIAPITATVVDGALAVAEEVLAERAEFSVDAIGAIGSPDRTMHEAVLIASARAVTAVGGDRRRGLGWVSITPIEPAWPSDPDQVAEHVARLVELLPTKDGQT
jgi:CRISPR/Cas system CSM-associated protein Csm3 (group 7 of RAMP superfamily)